MSGGTRHATVYDQYRRESGLDRSALKEAAEHKTAVYRRYKEVRTAAEECRDPAERARLKRRAGALHTMYKEACAEVRRLDPRAAQSKPIRRKENGGGSAALDVLMQSGALWSDLEGQSWSRLAGYTWGGEKVGSGRAAQTLARMVRDGLGRCTPRQQEVLLACYTTDDTLEEIGARLGVNRSTISRVASRGLRRVSQYVTAKLMIQRCVDEEGYFDYFAFVNSAQVLTERQKELMFLALARDTSYRDMANYVRRCHTTVWRTVDRLEERLQGIGVDLDIDLSKVKVRRQDWEGITEKELAQQLGLSARFYFTVVHWGERVDGIPLSHYVALRRMRETGDVGLTALELGYSVSFLKSVARQYKNLVDLPDVPVEDYRPARPRRVKLPENPYAAFGEGGAIIDHIDAETYRAIQAKFGVV